MADADALGCDAVTEINQAHATVGGFILRCTALGYRTGQLIAR